MLNKMTMMTAVLAVDEWSVHSLTIASQEVGPAHRTAK